MCYLVVHICIYIQLSKFRLITLCICPVHTYALTNSKFVSKRTVINTHYK